MLLGATLSLGLSLGPVGSEDDPPAAPTPAVTPAVNRRGAQGWLVLAPASVAVPGPARTDAIAPFDAAVVAGYRWSLGFGLAFEPLDHFLVVATTTAEQAIWTFDNTSNYELCFRGGCYGWDERGFGHLIRIGADARLGFIDDRWMAWGLVGVHLGLSRLRLDCNNSVEPHCGRGELDIGPGLGAGLGLAVRATPRFAVGLEGSVDQTQLDRREDPFRVVRTWDVSLVAITSF